MDGSGKAWVAGRTSSSLDGNANAGGEDMFLMTFEGDGNHLWTRQRGGAGADGARALQVRAFRCRGRDDGLAEFVSVLRFPGLHSCCIMSRKGAQSELSSSSFSMLLLFIPFLQVVECNCLRYTPKLNVTCRYLQWA